MSETLDRVVFRKATIAVGESLSDAIDVQGYDVVSLQQAASCEGTTFSFQGSVDGVTFADMYDSAGSEISLTKSASLAQCIQLGLTSTASSWYPLQGLNKIKIRTGLTAGPTVQVTADATILVGLRKV